MKKKKFLAIFTAMAMIFAIPQEAIGAIVTGGLNSKSSNSTNTSTAAVASSTAKTIYSSEKNGVKQYYTIKDGKVVPSLTQSDLKQTTNSSTVNTSTTNGQAVKSTTVNSQASKSTSLKTQNLRKSQIKNLAEKYKSSQKATTTIKTTKMIKDEIIKALKSNQNKQKYKSDEILIKFKNNSTSVQKNSVINQNSLKLQKTAKNNLQLFKLSKGKDVNTMIDTIKKDSSVEYVQPNYLYYSEDITAPNDPLFNNLWGLENYGQPILGANGVDDIDIDLLGAWDKTQGDSSLVVGVIDTGIDFNHPDLQNCKWENAGEIPGDGIDNDNDGYIDDVNGWDFFNNDNTVFDWEDGDEHGTHVSGTIAASINNNTGVSGIAPNVEIMSLKFLGPQGGDTYDAIMAIDYAKSKGVKLLNNSWGGGSYDQLLRDSIANCGALFVASAGNESNDNDNTYGYIAYPASYDCDNILSVAAVDNSGNLAGFSNYGTTSVDVAAPGVYIQSTVPKKAAFGAAISSSTSTYKTLFQGFGLELLETDNNRTDYMQKMLNSFGVTSQDKILIVQDDENDIGLTDYLTYYTSPLSNLQYPFDTITVGTYNDGPDLSELSQYKLVIWFTGDAMGQPINNSQAINLTDQSNLISYLNGGGNLFLSGRDAGWNISDSEFYQNYLHCTFIDECMGRDSVQGAAGSNFENTTYNLIPGIYIDYLKAADSNASVVLNYTPENNYDNAYEYFNGTSMAAPHVTGTAALVFSQNMNEDPLIVKKKIMMSSSILPQLYDKTVTGGIINANKALEIPDIQLDDDIPGIELNSDNVQGDLDMNQDLDDVYSIFLNPGETVNFTLTGDAGTDFDLHIYSPESNTVKNAIGLLASSENENSSNESIKFTAAYVGIYYIDVYAYAGSGAYTLTKLGNIEYEDDNPQIEYMGNWTSVQNQNYSNGTSKTLNSKGSLLFSFTGSQISYYGYKDAKQGIAKIYIDGNYSGDINLYAMSPQYNQKLFEKVLPYGPHFLEISWAGMWGDKTSRKTYTSINIDKLVVNTSRAKAMTPDLTQLDSYASGLLLHIINDDPSVFQYNIYRSTTLEGGYEKITGDYGIPAWCCAESFFMDREPSIERGKTYYYKVSAVNDVGESELSNSRFGKMLDVNAIYKVEDTNPAINYIGNWTTEQSPDYSGGTRHVTVNAGDKVVIPFTGFSSYITVHTGPDMGTMLLTWPGAPVSEEFDLYSDPLGIWNFGTDSTERQINANWILECKSGKVEFDVENVYDNLTVPSAPTTLNGTLNSNKVDLTFTGNPDVSVMGYNIYRSATPGSGYNLLNTTSPIGDLTALAQTYTDTTIQPGITYYYIVKAVNYAGMESVGSNEVTIQQEPVTPPAQTVRYEENDPNITVNGTWSLASGPNFSGGKCIYTNNVNNSIQLSFIGNSVKVFGLLNNVYGFAKITLDGTVYTVDTYAPTMQYNKVLFEMNSLTYGQHVIKIQPNGTTSSSNKANTYIAVDAIETTVQSALTTLKYEENDPNIIVSGTWSSASGSNFSGGRCIYTSNVNNSIQLSFTGNSVKVFGILNNVYGFAKITLDGTVYTVDTYASTIQYNKVLFEMNNLPYGQHVIKIQPNGTTSSSNKANIYIAVDAIEIVK